MIFRFRGQGADFKYAKGRDDIYGRFFHGHAELYLFIGGEAVYVDDEVRCEARPYRLFLIPRGTYHQFSILSDGEDYERYVLDLHESFPDFSSWEEILQSKRIFDLCEEHRIVRQFAFLAERLAQGERADAERLLNAVCAEILYELKYVNAASAPTEKEEETLPLRLMRFVNANYGEDLSLAALARLHFCSVSQICHSFKARFGVSIKQYLTQKRMEIARRAISNGESAQNVALRVGFSDYTSFFRTFKQYYGVSPSQCKRKTGAKK